MKDMESLIIKGHRIVRQILLEMVWMQLILRKTALSNTNLLLRNRLDNILCIIQAFLDKEQLFNRYV